MTAIAWKKDPGDVWTARVGPFSLKVSPKGDGRYNWEVVREPATNPTATGVASSRGTAKAVTEQFVKRSGLF